MSNDELTERLKVENWRKVNWKNLGFSEYHAVLLAEDDEIDFHDVEEFLQDHPACDPETALMIVR